MPKGMTKKQMGGFKRPKFLSKFPKLGRPNIRKLLRSPIKAFKERNRKPSEPKIKNSPSQMNSSSKRRSVAKTEISSLPHESHTVHVSDANHNKNILSKIFKFNTKLRIEKKIEFLSFINDICTTDLKSLNEDNKNMLTKIVKEYYYDYLPIEYNEAPPLNNLYSKASKTNKSQQEPSNTTIIQQPVLYAKVSKILDKLQNLANTYKEIENKYNKRKFDNCTDYYNKLKKYVSTQTQHTFNYYNLNLFEIHTLLFDLTLRKSCYTLSDEYKVKNRYRNIIPNPKTMVMLTNTFKLNTDYNYIHIHYKTWPDHGVPTSDINNNTNPDKYDYAALDEIIKKLFTYKTMKDNNKINVLVHCSAGVGRTGTFIMMCYLYYEIIIKQNKTLQFIDIYNALILLRERRDKAMVQRFIQFDYIMGYYKHLNQVNSSTSAPKIMPLEGIYATVEIGSNIKRNVDVQHVSTEFDSRANRNPVGIEVDNYINANYIYKDNESNDPFAFFNKIIAAQGPLPTTIDNFNQMIAQEEITHVIMVTNLVENRKVKCAKYFTEKNEPLLPNIKYNNVLDVPHNSTNNNYTIRDGTITFKEPPQPVDSLQKPDELEDELSNILYKKTEDEKNAVAKFLNLLRYAVEGILSNHYSNYNALFIDPYCIKIKLKRNTHISIYIINKDTGNIYAYRYTIPNVNAKQSDEENHNIWVNWLMHDINANNNITVEFYLYGEMIHGDQIVKIATNVKMGLNLPAIKNIKYTQRKSGPVHSFVGGARKYRSKKANKNKRSKTGKTKKRKC